MEQTMTDDLAIFIDSFDGNSDVWPSFFELFDCYWKNCSFKRYLICNMENYDTENLSIINTGNEYGWFPMTIKGLESIDERYIMFLLEDYAFSKMINNQDIYEIIHRMQEEEVFYYRLTSADSFPPNKCFLCVPETTPYPISLQPAIWDRRQFILILKDLYSKGAKTPWDFEKYFIEKYHNGRNDVMLQGVRYDTRNLLGYQNLIIQRKWDPRVVKYYKKQGIIIHTGSREYMSKKEVFWDGLKRNRIIRSLSPKNKNRIKMVLKKFGVKFMT